MFFENLHLALPTVIWYTYFYYTNLNETTVSLLDKCNVLFCIYVLVVLYDLQLSSLYLLVLRRSTCLLGLATEHFKIEVCLNVISCNIGCKILLVSYGLLWNLLIGTLENMRTPV